VPIVPTQPRAKRLLWDQFHSLKYPPGFLPRDVVPQSKVTSDQFDWNGDHPHTNFRELFTALRREGFFIDVLGEPYTCFDASQYGALLLVDPEDEFSPAEVEKLRVDVDERGLGLFVAVDWYDAELMERLRFFDDNTKLWWSPATGGSNVPAVNELLAAWGIAFGGEAFEGTVPDERFEFLTGNAIVQFPIDGAVLGARLTSVRSRRSVHVPYFGVLAKKRPDSGNIAVFGDSSCMDTAHKIRPSCLGLAVRAASFATGIADLRDAFRAATPPPLGTIVRQGQLPVRPQTGELHRLSNAQRGEPSACQKPEWQQHTPRREEDLAQVVFPVVARAPDEAPDDTAEAPTIGDDTTYVFPPAIREAVRMDAVYIVFYVVVTLGGMAAIVLVSLTRRPRLRRPQRRQSNA
jgi:membrane-bound transcription factor site-1 protease